jgi:hypothetical protein
LNDSKNGSELFGDGMFGDDPAFTQKRLFALRREAYFALQKAMMMVV